jgi:hypothetical protein
LLPGAENLTFTKELIMVVPQQPKVEYIDRPDLVETFIDMVRNVTFDGATVRAEFGVTRFEDTPPGSAAVARQYPACRLVLRPDAAVDLFVRLQRLVALMEQRGIVKREPSKTPARPADALENPLGSTGAPTKPSL